mgnify:FL=1
MKKNVLMRFGVLIIAIPFLYVYIKNPLEKGFNLPLITLIYALLALVISIIFNDLRRDGKIGFILSPVILTIIYFFL